MRTLGKVAFVPVIASGLIAGGTGAANAATAQPAAQGDLHTPGVPLRAAISLPFSGSVSHSGSMDDVPGGQHRATVQTGDYLYCYSSPAPESAGGIWYWCTDYTQSSVTGWVTGKVFGEN